MSIGRFNWNLRSKVVKYPGEADQKEYDHRKASSRFVVNFSRGMG